MRGIPYILSSTCLLRQGIQLVYPMFI